MSAFLRAPVFAIVPWLGLAGCGAESGGGHETSAAAVGIVQAGDAAPKVPALPRMSTGKPHAPVSLALAGDLDALAPGVPVSATLLLQTEADVDGVELWVQGSGGVVVLAPAGQLFLGPATAGQVKRVPIQLLAGSSDSPARLEALVSIEAGGETLARPVSLNLPVDGQRASGAAADTATQSKAMPVRDSTGELIYSMEAEMITE
jgi:hypothetical protein